MAARRAIAIVSLMTVSMLPHPMPVRAGDWPQWRGPNRDGLSSETGLLKKWPVGGPRVVWQVDTVGVGYSSLAVKGGRIYTQGDRDGVEHTIALDATTGKVLWAVQPEPVAQKLAQRVSSELKQLDRNRDGTIEEAEVLPRFGLNFGQFERLTEGDATAIAAERTARLFKQLDKDGDEALSYAEAGTAFRDGFVRIDAEDKEADAAGLAKSRADALFHAADKDQDGKLSRQESRGTGFDIQFGRIDRGQPGERDDMLSPDEVLEYLRRFEPGRDGLLTSSELAQYYSTQQRGKDGVLTWDELRSYYGGLRDGMGDGPRGTPTLDGDRLYVEGGTGDLTCLDTATGKTLWYVDLVRDLGGARPGWGYSESPLVEGRLLIVTPGGPRGTLAALDKMTGEVVWRSEGMQEPAQYSSPVAADLAGVRQFVQFARQSVFGVSAETGRLLWAYRNASNNTANICTPVPYQDHVFASSAYGVGGGLVRISSADPGQKADEVYFDKRMANHHGGIVRVGDHMYGFGNGGLICMDFLSGQVAWTHRSVNKGSVTVADGMLYCLGEGHQMALAEVTPEGYREHGRFKIDDLGRPSWAHPVVADGRLYIRNQQRLTAYDVRAQ